MASGMADWERVIRPKYGGAVQIAGQLEVDAGVSTRLAEIKGKGVLYGGTVWLDSVLTQANSSIAMKLDGLVIESMTLFQMNEFGSINPRSSVFTLNVYNGDEYIYSVGLSYGITFETYLDLYYHEWYRREPTVHYHLVYALL